MSRIVPTTGLVPRSRRRSSNGKASSSLLFLNGHVAHLYETWICSPACPAFRKWDRKPRHHIIWWRNASSYYFGGEM